MKVKNINGTSDNTCKCGSWIKHWEKFSGQTTLMCSEVDCFDFDIVGAHVQKVGDDNNWYIIPLCQFHNKHVGELEVSNSTKFVSANVNQTCGK